MNDAVLGLHQNPATCGVCKFNVALAKRLGVPFDSTDNWQSYKHPLVSVKTAERGRQWTLDLPHINGKWDLFLHDVPPLGSHDIGLYGALRIYAADERIAEAIRPVITDVRVAFCPSTVEGNPTRGAYRVLAFGMSHKLVLPHFEKLKIELDRDHPDYTIELSTAVHEGNPWDAALTESTEAMRGIFGERLRVLGFLADDALARVLQEVDAVAAFYVPALRANNTTAWAALSAGKFLYTNLDEHSPELNPEKYSWDALLQVLA